MTLDKQPGTMRAVLIFGGGVALFTGLCGRFKGIGTWRLGVDGYYISRSIDNILGLYRPRICWDNPL